MIDTTRGGSARYATTPKNTFDKRNSTAGVTQTEALLMLAAGALNVAVMLRAFIRSSRVHRDERAAWIEAYEAEERRLRASSDGEVWR
jgi:hypothetical protein